MIRKIVACLIFGLTMTGCATSPRPTPMAEYSFGTGCLEAYKRVCPRFNEEPAISECREDGLKFCDEGGVKFRAWIEAGKPK